jgi:L-2-hydroxyglutarate oxidase|tara:strand:- start:2195 stop:3373 length:1179 start_codon:yes stop_codon:yes gene_type:complete
MKKVYTHAVIGAGIVGLSVALKLQSLGNNVLVLDKEMTPGKHQSGRNSGVIHSGIYYKPNSFKSNLCIRGRELLLEFLEEENIPFRLEGKIVVDTDVNKLSSLQERATQLSMENVKVLEKSDILTLEPYCKFDNALHVPQAGVVDYGVVTKKLASKFQSLGGTIEYFQKIKSIKSNNDLKILESNNSIFHSEFLINCAGLYSDNIAQLDNVEPKLKIIPFRGEYFTISEEKSHFVNNMIYPISDPDLPFLGIHLTKTVDNKIEAGPNAVLAFAKEGYDWSKISISEFSKTIFYSGMWKLGKRHFSTGISEMYRSLNKDVFLREILKYIPDITKKDLTPRIAGVRAQAVGKDGSLIDDFVFEKMEQSLHVLNAPSPAATASLAIGEHIVKEIG